MSCENIPSIADLEKTKLHADDFGRLMGTGTGTSTNGVTGQVRPTFNKVINDMEVEFSQHIAGMAFTRVGTFFSGATLNDMRQVLLWDVANGGDGHEYGWTGVFPKVVPANSTPASTGGIGVGAWVDRSDVTLRSELAAPGGAGMIGDLEIYVTETMFAGGVQPYPYDSSPAINAAIVYANSLPNGGTVIIPEGVWGVGPSGGFEGIKMLEKVRLLGRGKGATVLKLLPAANSNVVAFAHDTTLPMELGCMTIDGNKTEQTLASGGVHGVRYHGNDFLYVHDIEVKSATYYGMGVGYSAVTEKPVADSRFERIEIYDSGDVVTNNGDGFDGKRCRRCSFSDIYVHDNLQRGIDIRGEQNTFNRIYSYNNGASGISARALGTVPASISQETYIALSNCYSVGNGEHGYIVANNEGTMTGFKMQVSMNNCWSTRSGVDGYHIFGTSLQVSLSSCFAEKNGQQGFRINSAGSDTTLTAKYHACQALSNTGSGFLVNPGIGPVSFVDCTASGNGGQWQILIDSNDASVIGGLVSAESLTGGLRCNGVRFSATGGTYKSGAADAFRVDGDSPTVANVKIFGSTTTTHFRINAAVTRGNVTGLDVSAVSAGTPFSIPTTVSVSGIVGGTLLPGFTSKVGAAGSHGLSSTSTSSTNGPTLTVEGPSADINLLIAPKGTGTVKTASSFLPTVTNSFNIGSAASAWAGGFTQTAFTVTSDERCKTAPLMITDAMLDAAAEVDWVQYQYLDRVEEKGADGARWHFGAIAQRYVEAFERHGLNAHDYGFICYDEWGDQEEVIEVIPAVIDDAGNEVSPEQVVVVKEAIVAGSRYGVRYEEALSLEAALQRRNYHRLLARVQALESQ